MPISFEFLILIEGCNIFKLPIDQRIAHSILVYSSREKSASKWYEHNTEKLHFSKKCTGSVILLGFTQIFF